MRNHKNWKHEQKIYTQRQIFKCHFVRCLMDAFRWSWYQKFASKFDFTGGHGRNGLLWTAGWLPSLPGSKFLLVVLFLLLFLSFWGDFKGNALPGNYLVVIITGQGLNVFLPVLGVGSFGSKNLGRYSSMWAVQCKFPHPYIQSLIHEKSCLERYIHQVTKIVHLIFKHLW